MKTAQDIRIEIASLKADQRKHATLLNEGGEVYTPQSENISESEKALIEEIFKSYIPQGEVSASWNNWIVSKITPEWFIVRRATWDNDRGIDCKNINHIREIITEYYKRFGDME
jgi:hypothetical protein